MSTNGKGTATLTLWYSDGRPPLVIENIPNTAGQRQRTPKEILNWMIRRRKELGAPLPEGYAAPPGIDIDELLRQLPPLPPEPGQA